MMNKFVDKHDWVIGLAAFCMLCVLFWGNWEWALCLVEPGDRWGEPGVVTSFLNSGRFEYNCVCGHWKVCDTEGGEAWISDVEVWEEKGSEVFLITVSGECFILSEKYEDIRRYPDVSTLDRRYDDLFCKLADKSSTPHLLYNVREYLRIGVR